MNLSVFRAPAAWLPLALSALALAVLACRVLIVGGAPERDEGLAAHLWQLLMAAQLPIIGWFLVRSAPRGFRRAAPVLAAQAIAILLAMAPVALLGL